MRSFLRGAFLFCFMPFMAGYGCMTLVFPDQIVAPITIEAVGHPHIDRESHVTIHTETGYGSGVVVSCQPDRGGMWSIVVLTCGHCVLADAGVALGFGLQGFDSTALYAEGQDYRLPVSRAIKKAGTDIGMIRFTSPKKIQPVPLCPTNVADGSWVWSVGYPNMADLFTVGVGAIASGRIISAPISFGSSGGAILNRSGEIVGLAKAIHTELGIPFTTQGVIVSLDEIKEFLSDIEKVAASRPTTR